MKKNILTVLLGLLTGALVFAQYPKTIATDPLYPTETDTVKVLINLNHWPEIIKDSADVYSGLITTKSKNAGDWKYQLGEWGNHPDSLKLVAVNDSIYSFTINNIHEYYKVNKNEHVFSIKFIARDQSGHQTEDLQLEVFGDLTKNGNLMPENATANDLVVVDLNIMQTTRTDLKDSLANNPSQPVYAYTAVNTNLGEWQHQVSDWGATGTNDKLKMIQISDSIFRLYIPQPATFYGVENPAEAITGLNFVFRNAAGNKQTEDIKFNIQFTAPTIISEVKDILVYPTFPTVSDKVFIYVNANAYGFNAASGLTAYTGLITSQSTDNKDSWKNIVNANGDWNDISLKLDRMNDSIHVFTIPSIKDYYKVANGDEVFRVTFIARDTAAGKPAKQTSNIYVEVYGKTGFDTLYTTQPAKPKEDKPCVVTLNVNKDTKTLAAYLADTTDRDVFAYTAINAGWTNQISAWDTVAKVTKLQTVTVNDSIYRFYIMPNARTFYGLGDTCTHVHTANLVFRNKAGNAQTKDVIVQFDTTGYKACENVEVAQVSKKAVVFYPNPAINQITVTSADAIKTISIMNLAGQQVKSVNAMMNSSSVVSVSDLQKGMYLIMVKDANNQITTGTLIKK